MWIRSDFLVDREEVDGFLRKREYSCVCLAETIERARAFPSRARDLIGLAHLGTAGVIDGLITAEREGTVHCVLPDNAREDSLLRGLLCSNFYVKKVTGLTMDTFRLVRSLSLMSFSTQSYVLMRLRNAFIAQRNFEISDTLEPLCVEIRDATESDLEALTSLHNAYEQEELLMRPSHAETEFRIRTLLAHQMVSIAFLNGSPIGKINTNARGIFCDQIGGFYVIPAYRGRGIGTALLHRILDRIGQAGKDAVLYVRNKNVVARRMYEHAGFQHVGEYAMSTVRPTH